MPVMRTIFLQTWPVSISSSSSASNCFSVKFSVSCCSAASPVTVVNGNVDKKPLERNEVRLGLPSKGRMATDTLDLLKDCQLSVRQVNPRQYVAEIPQLSNLEVWFQRPKDIVRKLVSGDLDLGIVGLDTINEYGQGNEDLILVHDALEYGDCRLSLALGPKFMKENGMRYVTFSTADGALEAAPAMGIADAIVDLVSSGTTLRENNLKEIEGGVILESQAVLVASRRSLVQRKGVLDITHEMLERLEAHLMAVGQFTVTANMRGSSADEVAARVLGQPSLSGLQGPTVSPVFCKRDGRVVADYYAIVICVPKKALYKSVQQLRAVAIIFSWDWPWAIGPDLMGPVWY
ncbi:UNVERIFIED_CONTAM: ATP phosphoribosyltransferase 2, chloroplastic [Sesamum angustifolium]|uniref:ATP phosphoribosyltransferase n=1 Tax=Sesamum angustifolium TaxID=2727405 RepID=A0AAW2QB56_9LAMI